MALPHSILDTHRYNLVEVFFQARNGKKGYYRCWSNRDKSKHYWEAHGNYGEEPTGFEAVEAAKNWIANGLSSLKQQPKISTDVQTTDEKES